MNSIADHGPIYAETNLESTIVEPWNAASNLIFLLILIYWYKKTKLDFKQFPLITFALPILLIGFIGGTIYHATRSHSLWLTMDWAPIMILTLSAAGRLWYLVLKNTFGSILITFVITFLPWQLRRFVDLPISYFIAIGYSSLAIGILLPAYLVAWRKAWLGIWQLNFAIMCFAIGITFRTFDHQVIDYLPMGSHFLWHIFGGLSVHFLISFLYKHQN